MINHFLLNSESLDILVRLGVAMLCGMVLGTERIISHKAAGMRTYALVSMGASLFVVIGTLIMDRFTSGAGFDPVHIMGAIISGIGFMGAGMIIFKDTSVTGLTTASGIWVAAGIGIACGFNLFTLAVIATLLCIFTFVVMWRIEQAVKHYAQKNDPDNLK
jgi:putative Mg2+ transporter-C (MgtC) family protein